MRGACCLSRRSSSRSAAAYCSLTVASCSFSSALYSLGVADRVLFAACSVLNSAMMAASSLSNPARRSRSSFCTRISARTRSSSSSLLPPREAARSGGVPARPLAHAGPHGATTPRGPSEGSAAWTAPHQHQRLGHMGQRTRRACVHAQLARTGRATAWRGSLPVLLLRPHSQVEWKVGSGAVFVMVVGLYLAEAKAMVIAVQGRPCRPPGRADPAGAGGAMVMPSPLE